MSRVALFIPCYVDQYYPHVGVAALRLLERLGCRAEVPLAAPCCGQPVANAGMEAASRRAADTFVRTFAGYDYVVMPSGSCAYHVRHHYDVAGADEAVRHVRARTYELCQFVADVLGVEEPYELRSAFPHRVGVHLGCHAVRGLALARPSEVQAPSYNTVHALLRLVDGIELVDLDRADECCGFGGTFAASEAELSVKMGRDRLSDHLRHGADVIASTDMSCLMHLEGLARRAGRRVRFMHVAEVLCGEPSGS